MPLYEYVCTACGNEFEQRRSMNEETPPCPSCGRQPKRRISMFASAMGSAPTGSGGGCACGGACGCSN